MTDEKQRRLFEKIKRGAFRFDEDAWGAISNEAKALIGGLLELDPSKRLTAKQTLRHPWMLEVGCWGADWAVCFRVFLAARARTICLKIHNQRSIRIHETGREQAQRQLAVQGPGRDAPPEVPHPRALGA